MTAYGEAAVLAARLAATGTHAPPDAWLAAAKQQFPHSCSQQVKGCPKGAFLGLCGAGLVRGIPAGQYTRSKLNAEYAVRGAIALKSNPALAADRTALWGVMCPEPGKAHNSQADVLAALFNSGLLQE